MWSRRFERCVDCGTAKSPHTARGLCKPCYLKRYRRGDRRSEILKQQTAWYERNREAVLDQRKVERDEAHFGGRREAVLARDERACTNCGGKELLVVHHKDGKGRGSPRPNNAMSNLTTLCRGCHLVAHRPELFEARRKNGFRRRKCGPYKQKHKI